MGHTSVRFMNPIVALGVASVLTLVLTGCATARGPLRVDDGVMPGTWPWSRVDELRPGAEISVSTARGPMRTRIFVSADDSSVTVLSLEAPSLPSAAIDTLRNMAARHPEYFAAMQTKRSFEQDGVRLGQDGLSVAGRTVAAFTDVVETLPREAVLEIRGPVVARGSVAGTIVGGWLGFCVGVVPALGGADSGVALLAGAVTVGGWLGHRWSNHTEEGVVYRSSGDNRAMAGSSPAEGGRTGGNR
jgi:hypothetical protein